MLNSTRKPDQRDRFRKVLREIGLSFLFLVGAYLIAYVCNSASGGYWLQPARDGRHRYASEFGGLSMTVAILWQPRIGRLALGQTDFVGQLFEPLILLDRKWIHPTHYVLDEDYNVWLNQLTVSKVHPRWRDSFLTKLETSAERDLERLCVRCRFKLTGSSQPRILTEIWLPRDLIRALGAVAPDGFTEMPFEGARAWRNDNNIRWFGRLSLPLDQEVLLSIPASCPLAGAGDLVFHYQREPESDHYHSIAVLALDPNPPASNSVPIAPPQNK